MEDFDSLIRTHYAPLLSYITRACGSEQTAEDILQEVFLQVWRSRESLPEENIRAYLYTVARHRMLDYLRSERRSAARDTQYFASEHFDAPGQSDPVENEELARAIRAAVDALPERAREIWSLNRDQNLSYQEIATILGISINTVKTQMTRAGAAIRARLVTYLDG